MEPDDHQFRLAIGDIADAVEWFDVAVDALNEKNPQASITPYGELEVVNAALHARREAWEQALEREGFSMREKGGEATQLVKPGAMPRDETMISIHVLIEKLGPVIEFLRAEGARNMATATIVAAKDAAHTIQQLLDGWASDDPTVRQVRGRVARPKGKAQPGGSAPAPDPPPEGQPPAGRCRDPRPPSDSA
jgi:hypothetical protein